MNVTRFFRQTITIQRADGLSGDGTKSYTTATTITGRMVGDTRMVRDATGREVVSTTKISTTASISVGDVVTDEAGTKRPVIQVSEARDTRGRLSHRIARL